MKNEHDSVLLNVIWHSMGIVPILPSDSKDDVNRALSCLPPEEAREMKRKFRKIWRKLAKQRLAKTKGSKHTVLKTFGLWSPQVQSLPASPTRSQKLNRKRSVLNHVYQNILLPMKRSITDKSDS